jgi:hypothetical protein
MVTAATVLVGMLIAILIYRILAWHFFYSKVADPQPIPFVIPNHQDVIDSHMDGPTGITPSGVSYIHE